MNCIRFNYLYRDASNYKRWGAVIFSNPQGLTVERIEESLRNVFDQGELFIAHQLGLPELFPYITEPICEDDHCYHEYESVELMNRSSTCFGVRTIDELLDKVRNVGQKGWDVFTPADRIPYLSVYTEESSQI